jgi:TonB family protein
MNDFLIYTLQTISIQFVFLLVYQVFLKEETFFKWNRIYLIGGLLVSFVIPLVQFSVEANESQIIQLNEIILSDNIKSGLTTISETSFIQSFWLQVLYFIGGAISFFFLVYKLTKIYKLITTSEKVDFNGTKVYKLPNSNQAFSFLNYIFIGDLNKDFELILKHELIHKKSAHSIDLLIVELLKIPFWFNPLLYVFQNKLAEIHEFEADATSVVYNKKEYYQTIINQVFQIDNIAFTNNFFNQSLIKKRIVMLQKSKSKKISMLKYATVIPVMLVSVMLFSTKAIAQEKTTKVNEVEEMPFATIDQIPLFKECEEASREENINCFNAQMTNHIKNNFTYPVDAAKNNIQGKVMIAFSIDKEGTVSEIKTKGPKNGALLEAEAKRIISLLPMFKPGKQKGKPVKVKYAIPLMFKLDAEKKNESGDLLPPPPPKKVPAPPKPPKK